MKHLISLALLTLTAGIAHAGNAPTPAPEIEGAAGLAALGAVGAVVALIWERRKRRGS